MNIVLQKTILSNFRNITETFDFNEGKSVFSGPNGCGKTTLFDASTWLHTGKDSAGHADFDLKTIKDGAKVSKINHSVFNQYKIDGEIFEFGRVFHEKWVKKRGVLEKVKDGNETDYYFGGLDTETATKINATAFKGRLLDAFGSQFQNVSDINHLATMPWKTRREILFPMVPSVDQAAIINSIDGLQDLLIIKDSEGKIKSTRTIEQAKAISDQRKKKIGSDLLEVNADIKANKKIVDSAGDLTISQAHSQLEDAEEKVKSAKKKIDDFNSGDQTGTIEELKKFNIDLLKAQSSFEQEKSDMLNIENKRKRRITSINQEIEEHDEDLVTRAQKRIGFIKEWQLIKALSVDSIDSICQSCGQELPDKKVQELKANFNNDKAEKLKANVEKGKQNSDEMKSLETSIGKLEEEKKQLESVEPDPILKQTGSNEVFQLKDKIEKLKNQEPVKEIPEELTNALSDSNQNLRQAQETKAAIKAVSDAQNQVTKSKKKKGFLSSESDKIEKFLSLYETFNQSVADAVEGPLNSMFQNVNFRMFDTLENGNIVPCCDVTDKENRPYDGALSNGEKIQAGLDIVRTLQKHFNIEAPVWIDNSESVTGEIQLDCQFIELRAANTNKFLTKVE